jgi:HEAT repeat protein
MNKFLQFKRCFAFAAAAFLFANAAAVFATGELPPTPLESTLIETLRTKPADEKAIACKQLAICGTKECVPELAKLLADKELSSWSRIALEAIPDKSADRALVKAAARLHGRLLVGTINSIGVRKTAAATEVLTGHLKDKDPQIASAAAVALGKIGSDDATKVLRASLENAAPRLRSAISEGCILCAERLNKSGKTDEAAAIYDEVRKAEVPKQRKLEATRGYIIAKGPAGIPTLVEQLHSSDKAFFQIGLMTARQLSGREVTDALSAELPKLASQHAVGLLSVLAERNDGGLPPAVLKAAKSGDKQLRIAAIGVVGRLGDATSVPILLEITADSDKDLAQAAASALATVPGENVDSELVANISKADGKSLRALIQAVGVRRIDATPQLMKALSNSDASIRHSALVALGETIKPKDLQVLIDRYLNGKNAGDTAVAGKALRTACVRMADREACAAKLAAAMPNASTAANIQLVEILAAMGGPKALATIGAAAKGSDAKLQDAATKALGKWMTVDAEPVLLDLAGEKSCKYQERALRGYIRLARQFSMPDAKRAQICDSALDAAKRDEDRKLVLEALERHPSADGLKVVVKAAKFPGLKDDVRQASLVIAQKVKGNRSAVRQALAEIGVKTVKIEIVKAEYGAGNSQRDVTELLKKDVGDFSVINLHSPSFNKSFGGDPAPGSTKQLVVEYRIDGKNGKATFAENDVIMLPTPQ